MKTAIIKNTSGNWLEIIKKDKDISIKAVGYPYYATANLTIENAVELRDFLNEILKTDK